MIGAEQQYAATSAEGRVRLLPDFLPAITHGLTEDQRNGAVCERIARLCIELQELEPKIRRSIDMPLSTTLEALHEPIEMAMGWTFSHLWEFDIDGRCFGDPSFREFDDEPPVYKAKGLRLGAAIARGMDRFVYVYDYGDNWRHDVIVEDVRDGGKTMYRRVSITGKRRFNTKTFPEIRPDFCIRTQLLFCMRQQSQSCCQNILMSSVGSVLSASGLPAYTIVPVFRTITRSEQARACCTFCSTSRTDLPSESRIVVIVSMTCSVIAGDRPVDGSSSKRSFGLLISAMAIDNILRSPPLSV